MSDCFGADVSMQSALSFWYAVHMDPIVLMSPSAFKLTKLQRAVQLQLARQASLEIAHAS